VAATHDEIAAIERAVAQNLAEYVAAYAAVTPEIAAAAIEVAGGVAAFCGLDSPLTTTKGIGAQISPGDCERVEAFFREHGANAVTFECAPWLSDEARRMLEQRGYRASSQEHVLLRRRAVNERPAFNVDRLSASDWPEVMLRGFELPDSAAMRALVRAAGALKDAQLWGIRNENEWIACAQSVRYDNVTILGCDGTLPEARGRGAQRALILQRLREIGPKLAATSEVAPGSVSERNYLRCGFEVAYARTHYTRTLH
jgi:hypothetical protein